MVMTDQKINDSAMPISGASGVNRLLVRRPFQDMRRHGDAAGEKRDANQLENRKPCLRRQQQHEGERHKRIERGVAAVERGQLCLGRSRERARRALHAGRAVRLPPRDCSLIHDT
jgi:hypothetical protein